MLKGINDNKIVELYNNGLSCGKISEIYNCNSETIRLRLKKLGVDTSTIINNPKCIYCNSSTQKHGKTKYGLKKYKCNECSKTFNENTNKEIEKRQEKYNYIRKLYLEEMLSTTEIGYLMGVSSTVIQRILSKIGVTRSVIEGVYNHKYKDFNGDVNGYLKTLTEYKKYKREVWVETNKQPINTLNNYDKRGLNGKEGVYQLDHKFSIFEGFKQNIKPEIIGNINNLEFIPWEENLSKGVGCSITKEDLINEIDIKVRVKS
jgi:transposase-like protein